MEASPSHDFRLYAFDAYRLDRRRRLLLGPDGRSIELATKSFDTLVYFLEHSGNVIDRATLLEAVWPQAVVDENNLSQAVAALRRILGTRAILTVPRQGYQFTLEVRRIDDTESIETRRPDSAPRNGAAHTNRRRPVFMRRAAAFGALGLGVVVLVVALVGQLRQPVATPETDTVVPSVANRGTLADAEVVEPSPTSSYSALARLVEAETVGWSDMPEAPDAQIALLDEAIRADPDFALAYARRASARMSGIRAKLIAPGEHRIDEDVAQVREDLERAIEIDPELGLAHAWIGVLNIQAGLDEGRVQLKRALELSPGDRQVVGMAALFSVIAGHSDDALRLFSDYEEQFDPIGFDWHFFLLAGDIESAAERARNVVSDDPTNIYHRFAHGLLRALLDERVVAERELRMFEALAEGKSPDTSVLANLVYAYGRIGLERDARRVFEELLRAVPDQQDLNPVYWLNAYLGLGQVERALEWAERSAAEPFLLFPGPELEFVLNAFQDPILERPEFAALRHRPELVALNRRPGVLD